MAKSDRAQKAKSSLRQAQRELTRNRIREAAKIIFYERHYTSSTMDEIASAADLSRATLYVHYKDKEEILSDIIKEYTPRAMAVLRSLSGPQPKLEEVEDWVYRVVGFVDHELIPLTIFAEVEDVFPKGVDQLMNDLIMAMGERNPIFKKAMDKSAPPQLRAKALLLLSELTQTSKWCCRSRDTDFADALVKVTAQDFTVFLSSTNMYT